MNAEDYSKMVKAAGRKIAQFIVEDETLQKMTRGEIKHALDSAYRDISTIFANVDLAQASSAVIAKHGSQAEPDGQESHPASES